MATNFERAPARRISVGRTWLVFLVLLVAVPIGLLLLRAYARVSGAENVTNLVLGGGSRAFKLCHPITLHVSYHHEKQIPGANGNMAFEGKATYTFKNTLPIPIKLAFPPLGYISGGLVPIAPGTDVVDDMPSFCKEKRVVELKPYEELRIDNQSYAIFGWSPRDGDTCVQFVFGKPADAKGDHFLIDAVPGIARVEPVK